MIDGNTHALNEYAYSQAKAEDEWELSKPEKCHKIVEQAIKLMKGECTDREFEYTFGVDDEIGSEFSDALDCWVFGKESEDLREIVCLAIEGASLLLYDTELSEIAYFNDCDWTGIMIDEIIISGSSV